MSNICKGQMLPSKIVYSNEDLSPLLCTLITHSKPGISLDWSGKIRGKCRMLVCHLQPNGIFVCHTATSMHKYILDFFSFSSCMFKLALISGGKESRKAENWNGKPIYTAQQLMELKYPPFILLCLKTTFCMINGSVLSSAEWSMSPAF